jgi:hypothetical protein
MKRDAASTDARPVVIVAANKRRAVDSILGTPPAADVQAVDVDACFAQIGKSDYVAVTPPGKPDQYSVTGGDPRSEISQWLDKAAALGVHVRLASGAECADVLAALRDNLPPGTPVAAWVEDGQGPSRCEPYAGGGIRVDPNKFAGYGGVIVLKFYRD